MRRMIAEFIFCKFHYEVPILGQGCAKLNIGNIAGPSPQTFLIGCSYVFFNA